MSETPYDQIQKSLSKEILPELIDTLPDKWEKIGDVLLIKLHPDLINFQGTYF